MCLMSDNVLRNKLFACYSKDETDPCNLYPNNSTLGFSTLKNALRF